MLPQAKPGLYRAQTPNLITHRVTRVIDTRYAVVDLAGVCRDNRPDSPPAGWKILDLLHKKIHRVNFFVQKIKSIPCCRRRSGLQVWHQAETSATAYVV
jgi:hypothetical protein